LSRLWDQLKELKQRGHVMAIEVRVPAILRKLVDGSSIIQGEGKTVGQLLAYFESRYPELKERLVTDEGKLHPFINLYLNDKDIRFLGEFGAPLSDGDVVSILPAIAGGKGNC